MKYKKLLAVINAILWILLAGLLLIGCGNSRSNADEQKDSNIEQTEEAASEELYEDSIDIATGLQVVEDEESGTKTIETDYFRLTLGNYSTWDYELDEYGRITIYCTRARNDEYGGRVMSVEVWPDPEGEPYDGAVPYKKIGIIDGQLIFVTYASDIQYDFNDEAVTNEYLAIRNETETIQEGGKSGPLVLK